MCVLLDSFQIMVSWGIFACRFDEPVTQVFVVYTSTVLNILGRW